MRFIFIYKLFSVCWTLHQGNYLAAYSYQSHSDSEGYSVLLFGVFLLILLKKNM